VLALVLLRFCAARETGIANAASNGHRGNSRHYSAFHDLLRSTGKNPVLYSLAPHKIVTPSPNASTF
jgi:hypothetical protein